MLDFGFIIFLNFISEVWVIYIILKFSLVSVELLKIYYGFIKVYKHLCYRNNYDIQFLILVTLVLIKLLSKLNVIFTLFVLL